MRSSLLLVSLLASLLLVISPAAAQRRPAAGTTDPYTVLGVEPSASAADIKRAYKTMAKKYHPDLNGPESSADRFMAISAAYQELNSARVRKIYDFMHPSPAPVDAQILPGWLTMSFTWLAVAAALVWAFVSIIDMCMWLLVTIIVLVGRGIRHVVLAARRWCALPLATRCYSALIATNAAAVIVAAWRLQHSYANPMSVMSVRRMSSPPPFTVAISRSFSLTNHPLFTEELLAPDSNMSLSCTQRFMSNAPCPRAAWRQPADGSLLAGTLTGDPDHLTFGWGMDLFAEGAQQGDCLQVQLLGVPLEDIAPENFASISNYALDTSKFHFCPQIEQDRGHLQRILLSFSALQDINGHVNFSISAISQGRFPSGLRITKPLLHLAIDIQKNRGLTIPWEMQVPLYTWADCLGAIFTCANITLSMMTALLYRGVRQQRGEFPQACAGKQSDDSSADGTEALDVSASLSRQRHERLLPRASLLSSPDRGALAAHIKAAVDDAVRLALAERDTASPPLTSSTM